MCFSHFKVKKSTDFFCFVLFFKCTWTSTGTWFWNVTSVRQHKQACVVKSFHQHRKPNFSSLQINSKTGSSNDWRTVRRFVITLFLYVSWACTLSIVHTSYFIRTSLQLNQTECLAKLSTDHVPIFYKYLI